MDKLVYVAALVGAMMLAVAQHGCGKASSATAKATATAPATHPGSPAATAAASRPATGPAWRAATQPLPAGDTTRRLKVDGLERSYLVHVPRKLDVTKPSPVVLAFHGGWSNATIMAVFSGLNEKADAAGFIVVYPNGQGDKELALVFNSSGRQRAGAKLADDVTFTGKLLDDLHTAVNVDKSRVFATGMSNGAMMCYLLAAEMSDRIAAIAPVAGTSCIDKPSPRRPVPVLHFHGTADELVRFEGPKELRQRLLNFQSVDRTMTTWAKLNGCDEKPTTSKLPDKVSDGMTVTRRIYGGGRDGSEVVLYTIDGGGHTWPGRDPVVKFLGKSTRDMCANDIIWEFFQKHPMK